VIASEVDERLAQGPLAGAAAALALDKARAVARRLGDGLVLGADTLVVVDGDSLGKPGDADEARAMLRRLRGRTHEVITGVAVVDAASGRAGAMAVTSRVEMRACTDREIDAYVATGEPLDKAGAYAIQERGGALVATCRGSRTNVIGLPVAETRRLLAAFGLPVSAGLRR
jgi:septum formation protein